MTDSADNESPKAILILKSNPLALQSAEQFLRTRGWQIHSTVSLTDSVQILFGKKIDYFLICANHSQKKVKTFPRLLSQFQNLRIIAYTDIANTMNMAILQELGIPYQILPPVSGPAIERMIFRIEKDLFQLKDNTKNNPLKGFLESLGTPNARKKVQEKLNLFFSNDNEENIPQLDTPELEITEQVESFAEYEERIRKHSAGEFAKELTSTGGTDKSYPYLADTNGDKRSHLPKSPTSFQQGIKYALDSSVKQTTSPMPVQKIGRAQDCICLSVESENFRGFLVAVMGQNRRFDDELLMNIQTKLFEFLRNEGLMVSEDKPMEIKIRPVDFEDWALEKAEFLKKSIHDGNEVAMAFFPTEKIAPNFGKSEAIDMISIDIDDLATDVPVTFDVYVHLPANNKYILYTPKGGLFMNSQKERLKAKGVDKMHTKKESTQEIKKYHAENTLNNSIQDFENTSGKSIKKA